MCYLWAHQFGTTICEINLGSWHKGSRSTWWREKHQFCPTKIGPSRQPLQWDTLPLKLWTVLLNCGIDYRFGIYPCSGLGVSLKDQTFGSSLAFFFSFLCFSLWGFLFLSSTLLHLLIIFQDCSASQHHGCWGCYENWSLPFVLLLKVSAHMCWCCRRSLNTGAAGVEGILLLLFEALKNHVSRFWLSCLILGAWVFSFSSSLMSSDLK